MSASSLVASLLLASSRCAACPCVITPGEDLAQPGTLVPRAYETAGVVFTARVIAADTVAKRALKLGVDSGPGQTPIIVADTVRYQVAVAEVWKGSLSRHAAVLAPGAYTSCGVTLTVGASYLLYAYGRAPSLMLDACARVTPLERAEIDQEVLRRIRGSEPRAPDSGGA